MKQPERTLMNPMSIFSFILGLILYYYSNTSRPDATLTSTVLRAKNF